MFRSDHPLFGPGGNCRRFAAEGHRSSADAPAFVAENGLGAYEYECVKGVQASEDLLTRLGENARRHGISLSLHAPYYISLSSPDPEMQKKNLSYLLSSLQAAERIGADTIVVHCGSAGLHGRDEAMRHSLNNLAFLLEQTRDVCPSVSIGMETMGRIGQLGTLEEVLEHCLLCPERVVPVVDFGHLNARNRGGFFRTCGDYKAVFDAIAQKLNDERARYLHCHFSHIEYGKAGEIRHLTFEDTQYGPAFGPLARVIADNGLCPRIICESAGTQTDDAMQMKKETDSYTAKEGQPYGQSNPHSELSGQNEGKRL